MLSYIASGISGNKFFTVISALIFLYIFFAVVFGSIRIIFKIGDYFREKSLNMKILNLQKKDEFANPLPLDDRIKTAISLSDLISTMIDYEVVSILQTYAMLNKPYEVSAMDNDIKKISSNVFNAIKPNIYDNHELIWTKEYLMQYISKRSTQVFFVNIVNHNNNIRSANS